MTVLVDAQQLDDRVDLVTLQRPRRRNALSIELVRALTDAVSASHAPVIVLAGSGTAFCSGGDLDDLTRRIDGSALNALDVVYDAFHALVRALTTSTSVVIAAINGPAVGAGLDLALCCDLRIAATNATFASSWVNVGLIPGMGGAHWLANAIGTTHAAEMLYTGTSINAHTALRWGLVNDVVEPEQLLVHVTQWANRLAEQSARALSLTKRALLRATAPNLDAELDTLGAVQSALLASPQFTDQAQRTLGRTR